jgi:hypothetical protein
MSGISTQNECRAENGDPPMDGGDVLLRPVNLAASGSDMSGTAPDGAGRPDDGTLPDPGAPNKLLAAMGAMQLAHDSPAGSRIWRSKIIRPTSSSTKNWELTMKRRAFPGYGPDVEARYQRAAMAVVFASMAAIYQNDKAAAWCKANGIALVRAAGETIGIQVADFVVPPDLANAILDLRDNMAPSAGARASCRWPRIRRACPDAPAEQGLSSRREQQAASETSANVDAIEPDGARRSAR